MMLSREEFFPKKILANIGSVNDCPRHAFHDKDRNRDVW